MRHLILTPCKLNRLGYKLISLTASRQISPQGIDWDMATCSLRSMRAARCKVVERPGDTKGEATRHHPAQSVMKQRVYPQQASLVSLYRAVPTLKVGGHRSGQETNTVPVLTSVASQVHIYTPAKCIE